MDWWDQQAARLMLGAFIVIPAAMIGLFLRWAVKAPWPQVGAALILAVGAASLMLAFWLIGYAVQQAGVVP